MKKRDLAEMLRESVAVAGGDHRCFNALISMPGLLPPLSMSRFSLLLLELFSKRLGKAAVPRGHVPPLRGDLRQVFAKPNVVLKCKQATTNICQWMTAG